jgi:hypothetical protein
MLTEAGVEASWKMEMNNIKLHLVETDCEHVNSKWFRTLSTGGLWC